MSRRPRGPSTGPKKQEWINDAHRLYLAVSVLLANGIKGKTRKALMEMIAPTEDLLIRARLIGQHRRRSTDITIGD